MFAKLHLKSRSQPDQTESHAITIEKRIVYIDVGSALISSFGINHPTYNKMRLRR